MKLEFWTDVPPGGIRAGKCGYFLRNPLKEFFEKLEKQGLQPMGIIYNGSYNLEIIVTEIEE